VLLFQITLIDNIEPDSWIDFIHFFRFAGGPRAEGNHIQAIRNDNHEPFIPKFVIKSGDSNSHNFKIENLIFSILDLVTCPESGENRWWKEIYTKDYLIPYYYINLECEDISERDSFTYRLDSFLKSDSLILINENSKLANNERFLSLWNDHYFIFNIEGGGLVSFRSIENDFFKSILPDHIMKHYYILYLISLQQKFFTTFLSEKIADVWLEAETLKENYQKYIVYLQDSFKEIQDLLLTFSSIGNYSQIVYSQHHHDVYKKWREILGIDLIYEEVKDEIEYIYNFI